MAKMKNKTQPRDVTDVTACTCDSLRKVTRVVTQAFNDALRPVDLRATQFSLLATLAGKGETPLTQLAEALVMDRTTLTRNLQPMVRRGLIHIGHEKDQRVRKVGITKAGNEVFENALPHWERVQVQISQKLGQERWSGLLDDLSATVDAVQER